MIKERTPLAMYEVKEIADDLKETDKIKEAKMFIKKFSKLSPEKSKKLKAELENAGIMKLRASDIIKVVDILPENAVELNKIFTEVSLDSDETNKILDVIKNNK